MYDSSPRPSDASFFARTPPRPDASEHELQAYCQAAASSGLDVALKDLRASLTVSREKLISGYIDGTSSGTRATLGRVYAFQEPAIANAVRLARLSEAEREEGKPSRKWLATPFEELPLPSNNAAFPELNRYRRKANEAGVGITAADLVQYERLNYAPQRQTPDAPDFLRQNVNRMLDVLHKSRPDLADEKRFRHQVHIDSIATSKPELYLKEYDLDRLQDRHFSANPQIKAEFSANFKKLADLPPMSEHPDFKEFDDYRKAMGAVGIRLQVKDLRLYRAALKIPEFKEIKPFATPPAAVAALAGTNRLPAFLVVLSELAQRKPERTLLQPGMHSDGSTFVEFLRNLEPDTFPTLDEPPKAVDAPEPPVQSTVARFEEIPLPPAGASETELSAYLDAANRAGANLTNEDVAAYDRINDSPSLLRAIASDPDLLELRIPNPQTRANVLRMADALAKQHPELVRDSAARGETEPERPAHSLHEQEAALLRLSLSGPMTIDPSLEELQAFRDKLAAVGATFDENERAEYERAVNEHGLERLTTDTDLAATLPLGAAILLDLRREPQNRVLLGADVATFEELALGQRLRALRLPGKHMSANVAAADDTRSPGARDMEEIDRTSDIPDEADHVRNEREAATDNGVGTMPPDAAPTTADAPPMRDLADDEQDYRDVPAATPREAAPRREPDEDRHDYRDPSGTPAVAVKADPYERLAELEKKDGRSRGFHEIPLPRAGASLAELDVYRTAAAKIGIHVTAADLEAFDQLAAGGPAAALRMATDAKRLRALVPEKSQENVYRMLDALAGQTPDAAQLLKAADERLEEVRAAAREAGTPARRLRPKLPDFTPPREDASRAEVRAYCASACRGGVRLRAEDLQAFAGLLRGGPETALLQGVDSEAARRALPDKDTRKNVGRMLAALKKHDPATERSLREAAAARTQRFAQLRELESRDKPSVAFEDLVLPPQNATFAQLNAYALEAHRAGVRVSAADLKAYGERGGAEGLLFVRELGFERTFPEPAQRARMERMAEAAAKQHPELVSRHELNMLRVRDNQDDLVPGRLDGLAPERVTADPAKFAVNLAALAHLPAFALPANAERFERYRDAMHAVGIRFTVNDLERYTKALALDGPAKAAALAQDEKLVRLGIEQKMPLALTVLAELRLPKDERRLLAESTRAAEFADILRAKQELPPPRVAAPLLDPPNAARVPQPDGPHHDNNDDPRPANSQGDALYQNVEGFERAEAAELTYFDKASMAPRLVADGVVLNAKPGIAGARAAEDANVPVLDDEVPLVRRPRAGVAPVPREEPAAERPRATSEPLQLERDGRPETVHSSYGQSGRIELRGEQVVQHVGLRRTVSYNRAQLESVCSRELLECAERTKEPVQIKVDRSGAISVSAQTRSRELQQDRGRA